MNILSSDIKHTLVYCRIKIFFIIFVSLVGTGCNGQDFISINTGGGPRLDVVSIKVGGSPIHWAAANGDIEMVRQLLASGTDVNHRVARTKATPLHFAAWKGQYEVSQYLIEQGAELNANTVYKNRPIHYASGSENRCYEVSGLTPGHLETVKLLVNKGASVDPRNAEGVSPLQNAAGCDALHIAKFLIDRGANIENRSLQYSVLDTAAFWSRKIALLLIEQANRVGAYDKNSRVSPLTIVIKNNDAELVRAILSKEVNLNSRASSAAYTPLGTAINSAGADIVKLLLEHGADPELRIGNPPRAFHKRDTPFISALVIGDTKKLQLLIDYGAKIPAIEPHTDDPLIYYAVEKDNIDVVRWLLQNNVDPNVAGTIGEGFTALHMAALNENPEMVKILLTHNANPNAIYEANGKKPRDMTTNRDVIEIFNRFNKTNLINP